MWFQSITAHDSNTIMGLYAALILASLISRGLAFFRPEKNYTELRSRVRSWWIIITVFSLSIIGPRNVKLGFLGFVSFLAFKEYVTLIATRRADRRVLFWAYLAIPLQFYWIATGWYSLFLIFIPVYAFLFIPLRMVTIGETKGFLHAAGTIHWGLMTTVFCLSHIAYLFMLPEGRNPAGAGPGLVLFIVIVTELNDVAQYCWGKTFGRHKVIPKVSPNKTWEGLLGGIFTTTLVCCGLGPYLTPMLFPKSLFFGVLLAISGFIGDVVISAIKRDLGVKDAGSLLPGHGGILDRVDSLTYTAPLFFHFIYYFYY